jgi:putative transposase
MMMGDDMPEPILKITRRRLPHWTLPGSTYYVTFCVADGTLSAEERRIVLTHVKEGHGRYYDLAAATVMPDHVHLILKPLGGYDLPRIVKGIKGVTARLVNARRGAKGRLWQEDCWDRILRDTTEFDQKLQYMYDNAVKARLAAEGGDYDYWYFNPDFA